MMVRQPFLQYFQLRSHFFARALNLVASKKNSTSEFAKTANRDRVGQGALHVNHMNAFYAISHRKVSASGFH